MYMQREHVSGADAHALITIDCWIRSDSPKAKWTQCAWSLYAKLNKREVLKNLECAQVSVKVVDS